MPIRCCYKPGHHFPAEPPDLPGRVYWIRANTNLPLTGSREGTGVADAATGDTACAPGDNRTRPAPPPLPLIRRLRNLRRSSLATAVKFARRRSCLPAHPCDLLECPSSPGCRGTAAPRPTRPLRLHLPCPHCPSPSSLTPSAPPAPESPSPSTGPSPETAASTRATGTVPKQLLRTRNADSVAFRTSLVPKPAGKAILLAVPINDG